jgi:hypothetical protein
MTRFNGTLAAMVLASATSVVAAQNTNQPGKDELHVSGCLASDQGKFLLRDATLIGTATKTRAMPTAGAANAPAQPRTYELRGSDLQRHVGQKVEVTATLDDSKGAQQPQSTTATTPATEVLKVSAVKSLATTCS